jgi:glycosyltransferase involved in cell wall biosynthesis
VLFRSYDGGSHAAFLAGWRRHGRHRWTRLGLPANRWKWRMRHAAATFADSLRRRVAAGGAWDVILASDMLDLAAFRGLAPAPVRDLPAVLYFHENQLTYPVRREAERDYHFPFTNFTAALAADALWFNSAFHRDEFLAELPRFLARMPGGLPAAACRSLRGKASVQPPGIIMRPPRPARRPPGPLRLLWNARWEFDKDPDFFFAALRRLKVAGTPFHLYMLGERFREAPPVFAAAAREFAAEIRQWGFLPRRADYLRTLRLADVVVSTAQHEFFGIAVAEAVAAGAFPVLPERLAYPELLRHRPGSRTDRFFYRGGPGELARRLRHLASLTAAGRLWEDLGPEFARQRLARLAWPRRATEMDAALEHCRANPR